MRPGDPEKSDVGIPLLVVEVLSRATRRRDHEVKRHRLLAAGVREVWSVDPDRREIERFDVDGCEVAGPGTSVSSRALRGFSLAPDDLFSPPK